MRINGINGVNTQSGGMNIMQTNDSVSKNIQNQIANAQKQLQELSSNKEMSIEEKMKRRQEIQQQITDLNNQLRQHLTSQRKEQQAKKTSMDDMLGSGTRRTASKDGNQGVGLSQASMKVMMSADSAKAQAQVQGSVATKLEGRAGILESEIKLDSARGGNVEKKQEELAEVRQMAAEVQSAQMNTLAETNKELEGAAKAERQVEKTDIKAKKADKKNAVKNGNEDNKISGREETESMETDVSTEPVSADVAEAAVVVSELKVVTYTHVDVVL